MSDQASVDLKNAEMAKTAHVNADTSDNVKTGTGYIGELDKKVERSLVWKFDLHILPVLAIMYLFNSLDKSNLGRNSHFSGSNWQSC